MKWGKKNLRIKYIGLYDINDSTIDSVRDAGIEDFLSYIDGADLVLTNSFHATVFSILFNKLFVSFRIASTSSRVESLLKMLNLTSCLVDSNNWTEYLPSSINYEEALSILKEERIKSLNYLKQICQ